MLYLDLEEVPQLIKQGVLSARRFALASFLPNDHLSLRDVNSEQESLTGRIANFVQQEVGLQVDGPIRLLTQLRYFSYYFSPLNLYYCFNRSGEQVVAVVAEVSNTPWREQHCYVLHQGNCVGVEGDSFEHRKTFHVSPFMHMNLRYAWKLNTPGKKLNVNLLNQEDQDDAPLFSAQLKLESRPLSRSSLLRTMVRYPVMTAQIMSAIYYQAFKLWWKKCPYYPHPKNQPSMPQANTAN